MPEPYNYMIQIPSMFERISQLQAIDAQDEQAKALKQDREIKLAAQNMAMEQRKRQNAAMDSLIQHPNPTRRDFEFTAMQVPKDQAEIIQKAGAAIDEDTQKKHLLFGGQVLSSIVSDRPEVAIQMLDEKYQSETNAGRDGRIFKTVSKAIAADPKIGFKTWGAILAAVPGGINVIDAVLKAQKGPSEVAKSESEAKEAQIKAEFARENAEAGIGLTRANIKNVLDQVDNRAKVLGLDKDKLASEMQLKIEEMNRKGTELDPDARKIVNTAMADSAVAMRYSGKLNDLADRVLENKGGKGSWNTIGKFFENLTGTQDEWTQIRNEYIRIKNQQAIKNLPPGPASTPDMILAQKGLPPETANAEYIASFLRGMAQLSSIDSSIKAAEADWVNSSGSLGRPKRDINVQGMMVPAGTSFNEFMYIYLDKTQKEQNTKAGAEQAKTKGYMKYGRQ
jgi:hypothetical protein